MGDLNARVRKQDDEYNKVIGKFVEGVRNHNGRRLLDVCTVYDLIIASSFFQYKDIDKYTRVVLSREEYSIIDYIIVESSSKAIIKDIVDLKFAATISW